MRVTVLGASRNTGKAFVEQALEKGGLEITILARTPERLTFTSAQLAKITVVKGDATAKADVARAIEGADMVVSSLGGAPSLTGIADAGVEEVATLLVLEAIKETRASSPPRLIMVSSTGVGTLRDVPLVMRPLYGLLLRTPHRHKAVAEAAIRASGVPFTLVRPALMTNGPLTRTYRAAAGASGYTISRNDVAHFVLEQCVLGDAWVGEAPVIAY
ncbi:hypothetical protein IWQ56_000754 [Coemansia nantahalensis]|uniref:Uncharacterized protein n=1 Tax=Coemansia nantahalensis TaxID=2789366 RepID=A0ACC1K991_9FUNG|nr:hypothetical protein IWQ56_000754 [Coemansia nantahalensis]KAJ2775737.1 hypothetical protein IWQ57_000238 [Coemansia nantahalensis]